MIIVGWQDLVKDGLKRFKSDASLKKSLEAWFYAMSNFVGNKPNDLKNLFSYVDVVPPQTVFNIRGNHYRLIAEIDYQAGVCVVTHLLTHKEYDKAKWKK